MNYIESNDLTRAYDAMESEDYRLARELFEQAIGSGARAGSIHLGWLFEQGLGGSVDVARALQLYELGRSDDRQLGSYHLGSLLMKQGQSDKARQLLEESANLGHASAAYWAYVLNDEVVNKLKARHFLARAAELGHAFAQRDLARQEMREASSIGKWVAALWAYWRAKARGSSLAVRDVHDPRVR